MKHLFLIACLFCFQAFSETECEKAKQALEETKLAHDEAQALSIKNSEIKGKAFQAYSSAYYAWERALRKVKANKGSGSQSVFEKADVALDKAEKKLREVEIKTAWGKAKAENSKGQHLEDAKKLKTKVIKDCKVDDTKTKSIFPYYSANPNEKDNLEAIPLFAPLFAVATTQARKRTQGTHTTHSKKKKKVKSEECKEAEQTLENAKSSYSKTKPALHYQRTRRLRDEALKKWVKKGDIKSKLEWEKADKAHEEARIAWKEEKVGKQNDTASQESLRKHLQTEMEEAHRKVITACKMDKSKIYPLFVY